MHVGVQKSLHSLMSKFLLGGGVSDNIRKLHLIDLDTVSTLIDHEGLGIARLNCLSTTLIVKWIYMFAKKRNSLWRKVVYEKKMVQIPIECFP